MRVVEKPGIFGSVIKSYEDVDVKFKNFAKFIRVLPAPFFEEPHLIFTLKAMYEPGSKFFPNGGFEVYLEGGGTYSYDLDQVIVHPQALGIKNFNKPKNDKSVINQPTKKYVATGGPRGRKPLDPLEKAKQETEALERKQRSGGKRGRPSKANS
jgi:hypothetical protein